MSLQKYLPMFIESCDFRVLIHSKIYGFNVFAIHDKTIEEATDNAKIQIPRMNKTHNDNFSTSGVEQLVKDRGKEYYKKVDHN